MTEPKPHASGFARKQEVGVKNLGVWLLRGKMRTISQVYTHLGSTPNRSLENSLQDDISAGQLESRKYLLLLIEY